MTGSGAIVIVYFLLLILVGLPCALSAYRVYKAMTLNEEESEGVNNDEEPSFRSWTAYVITKPKAWYCHLRLGVTFVLFFLWPGISLFTSNLPKAGVIFLFTSIFSLFRLNLDAGNILKEHSCRLMDVELCKDKKSSQQQMIARARASQVLSKITNSFLYFIAIISFGFMGGYFVYFSGTSAGSGEDYNTQEQREPIRLLEDFYPLKTTVCSIQLVNLQTNSNLTRLRILMPWTTTSWQELHTRQPQ